MAAPQTCLLEANVCFLVKEPTQGDTLAMGMYAVGIMPLIKELQGNGGKQLWYADDASDAGSLKQIRSWMFSELVVHLMDIFQMRPNLGCW